MNDQMPPFDIEAEEACLAAALVDSEAIDQMAMLEPEHFFREKHQFAWRAIQDLRRRGSVVDQVTLAVELSRRTDGEQSQLDTFGGQLFMAELIHRMPMSAGAEWWAKIVTEAYNKRVLLSLLQRLAAKVYQAAPETTAADLASRGADQLARVSANRDHKLTLWPNDVLDSGDDDGEAGLTAELNAWLEDPSLAMGIETGIPLFDEKLLGLQLRLLHVLLANTSRGKSWLVAYLALQIAWRGVPVWICSSEMSSRLLAKRIIAMIAGVDRYKVNSRQATEDDKAAMRAAAETYRTLPIGIMSRGRPTLSVLVAEARRQVKREGVQVVFVDHIQHVRPSDPRDMKSPAAHMAEVVASLKDLSVLAPCAVFAISHINRADAKAGVVTAHSGKESSSIEQDADVIITMEAVEWANRQGVDRKWRWAWWPLDEKGVARFQETWNAVPMLLEIAKGRDAPKQRAVLHLDWDLGGRFEPFDQTRPEAKAPELVPA